MKAEKGDDAEVEKAIWDDAAAEVFKRGYRTKRHEPLFQHLRKIMAKRFNHNVTRRFVRYMVDAYGASSIV